MDVNQVYEPVGCPECSSGYHGRIALQEVLLISPDIRDAINARMPKAELRAMVYGSDVITLLQDGLYKVIAGLTSISEVIKLTEADDEVNAEEKVKSMIKNKTTTEANRNTNFDEIVSYFELNISSNNSTLFIYISPSNIIIYKTNELLLPSFIIYLILLL